MTSFRRAATVASISARPDTDREPDKRPLGLLKDGRPRPAGHMAGPIAWLLQSVVPNAWRTIRPHITWRHLLAVLGATYLFACWGAVIFERRFTYQPDPSRVAPEAVRLSGVAERILTTPDGQRLVAWQAKPKPGQPTLLYFHGNGNALTYRSGRMASFQAEGYGVLMLAYRGYSGSTGGPAQATILADARFAYDTLRADGLKPDDIVIYGESLGSSVAVHTAAAIPARALILEAPFTSMVDAWKQFVPYLPVGLLLHDRFDSRAVIGRVNMPILMLHGERDRLVGFELGRALYAAALEPKRFESFPEAGHTNLYDYNAIAAVRTFLVDVKTGKLAGTVGRR